jgi:hypothetical protein
MGIMKEYGFETRPAQKCTEAAKIIGFTKS